MLILLTVVHLFVAVFLCVFVLMQDSKGGAMGALGGGTSNTVFGSTGASNFLTKTTRWLAIFFAATCLGLVWLTTSNDKGEAMKNIPAATEMAPPSTESAAPAEAAPPATPPAKE